ncbi:MAG TPA: hypothetical protein VJ464_11405 [Blastocatellia bacterium]|nr:hypothetical protein [Blastocatellia bacterium]
MSLEIEKASSAEPVQPLNYTPRTLLGEKLLALRREILSSGARLLDQDEVEKEIAERRGEDHHKTL